MSLIYLDYNATTPMAESVIEVIYNEMKTTWGNPSSSYLIGRKAKNVIENARERVADMLGTKPCNIIFTSGGTEASNMAIFSAVKHYEKQGQFKPHVITSSVEHDATFKVLEHLKSENKIDISFLKPSPKGDIAVRDILNLLSNRTCFISMMMANNETGVIFPISELGKCLEGINKTRMASGLPKVFLHTDAAQVVGKIPLNAEDVNADYITVAGHKFYGPKIGCLYFRNDSPVYPIFHGGGQENGLRSGTENTPLIAGFGEAARIVTENLSSFSDHMTKMRNFLQDELKKAFSPDEIVLNFTSIERLPNTLSISFPTRNARQLLQACEYVVASTGSACHSSSVFISRVIRECLDEKLWQGTVRLSVGRETSITEIKMAVGDLVSAFNKTESTSSAC